MRIMLLVLALLIPEGAMAARWEKDVVSVWDMGPEAWRPFVQAAVADFNAVLPPEAPRLLYVPMEEMACDALPEYGRKGGVTVCPGTAYHGYSGVNNWFGHQAKILASANDLARARFIMCHELGHAIIGIPDDHSSPEREASCVQGTLDHLGPWDIAYAEQVYGHKSKRKHRH